MKFNSLSLRLRLTLLMAVILLIACISLMVASIYAARVIYVQPQLAPKVDAFDGTEEGSPSVPPVPSVLIEQQIDFASAGFLFAILIIASRTGITYISSKSSYNRKKVDILGVPLLGGSVRRNANEYKYI